MISIIVPIYNQYSSLDVVLWHFCRQTVSEPFEIIIVDDGSLVRDTSVIEKYPNLKIKYFQHRTNKGRSCARNTAIDNAIGEFLIFCDCDRLPVPNFVQAHMDVINSYDNVISIGNSTESYIEIEKLKVNAETISRRKSVYYKVISQIYEKSERTDSHLCWLSTLSGNMALRKSSLAGHRFDCDFKDWGFEHFELGYRLWKAGISFIHNTRAENIHMAHSRKAGFYNESINSSHRIFYCKHPNKEIWLLKAFMLGEISLQAYEQAIHYSARWMKDKPTPITINLINL